jgi:hypothetical protein
MGFVWFSLVTVMVFLSSIKHMIFVTFSLRCAWVFKYYLDELQLQRVKNKEHGSDYSVHKP